MNKEARLRKTICKAYMTKDWYLGFIKNSYDLIIKRTYLIMGKNLNGLFTKKDISMINKHMKKYSTS